MSFARPGLGALIAAASLYATAAHAADVKSGASMSPSSDTQGASSAHAKPHWASGDVKSIDEKALTLTNGEQVRLTSSTRFEQAGKKVSLDQVKPGEKVKAAYQARGKLAYADRVDISSNPGASTSMKPSASQQGTGSAAPGSSNKKQ